MELLLMQHTVQYKEYAKKYKIPLSTKVNGKYIKKSIEQHSQEIHAYETEHDEMKNGFNSYPISSPPSRWNHIMYIMLGCFGCILATLERFPLRCGKRCRLLAYSKT